MEFNKQKNVFAWISLGNYGRQSANLNILIKLLGKNFKAKLRKNKSITTDL
jgi:hypothetical protein